MTYKSFYNKQKQHKIIMCSKNLSRIACVNKVGMYGFINPVGDNRSTMDLT